jgi:hypothetical protein
MSRNEEFFILRIISGDFLMPPRNKHPAIPTVNNCLRINFFHRIYLASVNFIIEHIHFIRNTRPHLKEKFLIVIV